MDLETEKIKTFVITPCLFMIALAERTCGHVRYLHVMFAIGNIYIYIYVCIYIYIYIVRVHSLIPNEEGMPTKVE